MEKEDNKHTKEMVEIDIIKSWLKSKKKKEKKEQFIMYKGIKISKDNADKDKFKVDLLNMLGK